jgi:general secretion pathway protein L
MMAAVSEAKALFADWIAAVSRAVDLLADRFVRSRRIRLTELDDGRLAASTIALEDSAGLREISFRPNTGELPMEWAAAFRGSRVEVELQPAHVMTHLLDFPSKASGFLDGMIRAQIDRLTPWTVDDAVFGWSPLVPAGSDRIEVTLAATSKLKVAPLLQLVEALDAASVAVYATAPAGRIPLLDKPLRSVIGPAVNVPRLLRAILLVAGIAGAASLLIGVYLGDSLQ